MLVAALHRGVRIVGAGFGFAVDHGAIGEFFALPAIVAIHGVVAADDGGDLADAELAQFLLELLHIFAAAVRRRVAAVHEAVNENVLDFFLRGHFEQREKMMDVRMDAAVAEESDQMEWRWRPRSMACLKSGTLRICFVGDEQIDAGHVHVDDAACADVEVADFAVAHLAVGEADGGAGSVNQRVGEIFEQES